MAERSAVERALRAELAELRAVKAELRLQCELYADQVASLRELERRSTERDRLREQENQLLAQENGLLRERVADLEARLGRNSRNSNTPPSAEGYTKPPPRSSRRSSGRKPGGQPGASGTTLRQVDDPDEVIVHVPSACGGCGASLAGAPVASTEIRQVADLPEVALRWVEHRIEHRGCQCGATTMAAAGDGVPEAVRAPVSYGPGVRAVATYLVAGHHLPLGRAAAVMSDLLGAPVSPGSVAAWVQAAADGLGPFTDAVRDVLTGAGVVNFDETGLRVDGALGWVHSASTDRATLYTCHARRGREAMDAAGVLPGFTGIAVHDCWKPYWCYQVEHALCNAHVVRELTGVYEATGQTWAPKLATVLDKMNIAVAAKDAGTGSLEPAVLAGWHARIDEILVLGRAQNPEPAGGWPSKRPVAVNLLDRFETHRAEFLRFATDFRVPFTNNAAEQAVRPVKIRQKISGCLRTMTGAQAFCSLRSYLATSHKQGRDALAILRQLHEGQPWLPAPGIC
jgi:transposase